MSRRDADRVFGLICHSVRCSCSCRL